MCCMMVYRYTSVQLYVKVQKLAIIIICKLVQDVIYDLANDNVSSSDNVSHVRVTDIQYNYDISGRLISVYCGL
jgi:hypothetical protein